MVLSNPLRSVGLILGRLLLSSAAVLLVSCSTASMISCDEVSFDLLIEDSVPAPQELEELIEELVQAHCRCSWSSLLLERVHEPPLSEAEIQTDPRRWCLGPLVAEEQQSSRSGLMSLLLVKQRQADDPDAERWVVFASYVDDNWYLSWPASLGSPGPLHRKMP